MSNWIAEMVDGAAEEAERQRQALVAQAERERRRAAARLLRARICGWLLLAGWFGLIGFACWWVYGLHL